MASHTAQQGISVAMPPIPGNALVHRVRNLSLKTLRPDTDYVLFCDDDMCPEQDALLKLLEHRVPVASALCTTRNEWPPRLAVKVYDQESRGFFQIEEVRPGAIIKGAFGVGAAFVLVQRSILDRLIDFHLEAVDWLELNRPLFDRLHVRAENRDKERRRISALRKEHYQREQYLKVFAFSTQDNELERGEDVHFSLLLRFLGVPILIDSNVIVGHIGSFPYSPYLMNVYNWRELKAEDLAAPDPLAVVA